MPSVLESLVALGALPNSPATESSIQQLESACAGSLPEELRALYRAADGMSAPGQLPLRLLSTAEILRDLDAIREALPLPDELLPFWADDQDNYAAVYLTGPLAGRVSVINHDEVDTAPVYRDLETFHAALLAAAQAGQDWSEMLRSRPVGSEGRSAEDEKELALALKYQGQAAAAPDAKKRKSLLFKALALFPLSETHRLVAFLQDGDMWVQERACQLLAQRRHVPAIPAIAELARNGRVNARIGAMTALREWDHPAAQAQRERLLEEVPPEWRIYLQRR
jgi:hypothetical protein